MPRTRDQLELTKCESEVMDIVWAQNSVTVHDVVAALDRDLAYTTVMTTLKILEDKNFVRRGSKVGRAYTYEPVVSRDQVRRGMLQSLTDQLFGGSPLSLVLSLVESRAVTEQDIEAIRNAVRATEPTE